MRSLLTLLLVSLCGGLTQAQTGLIAYYSFDDGTATDLASGNSNGVLSDVAPTIGCGIIGNGLAFDGENNYVDLLGTVSTGDYFRELGRFTISFYFRAESPFGTHDILSKRESCGTDNSFAIRYTPSSRVLSVELNESNDRNARYFHTVEDNSCWIHVVITKTSSSQALYVNGQFVADARVSGNLDLTSNAIMKIADSPCLGTTDRRFSGVIDELRIYQRALRDEEIAALYIPSDQIITNDTTIFLGDDVTLRAGGTCAGSLMWVPGGSNPFDFMTTYQPAESQTYALEYQYDNCISTDSVVVNVIDPTLVDCGDLPMPNAFTPNGDGRNDEFFISNPFSVQELVRFEIFDTWGNKVFAAADLRDAWDGRYQGQAVNPGVFVYKIRYGCGGEEFTKTGSVMVLK